MTGQFLYLAASLAGVAMMAGLCTLLFGGGVACIDADSARARLREDVPGFRAGAFVATADGDAALMEDARDGAVYLVVVRGSGLVTRKLSKDFLRKTQRNGASLDLRFADFTFPRARLPFAKEIAVSDWEARLSHAH